MSEGMFYEIQRFFYYFTVGIFMFFLSIFFVMMFGHSITDAANIAWYSSWIVMPFFMVFMFVKEKNNPLPWIKQPIGYKD